MKVKELINKLKTLDPEMDVYIYTDHGQQTTSVHCADETYMDSEGELYADEDVEGPDGEDYDCRKVVLIE